MDRATWLKAVEPLQGDSLLLTTKSPGVPGPHLIDIGRLKLYQMT